MRILIADDMEYARVNIMEMGEENFSGGGDRYFQRWNTCMESSEKERI